MPSDHTRRDLLTGAAAKPKKRTTSRSTVKRADAVVVGAGLSGVGATRRLLEEGKSVYLIEANDRVGGRTHGVPLPSHDWYVEHGGVFIVDEPREHRLMHIASEVGVGTIRNKREGSGDHIYHRRGTRARYSPTGPAGRVPAPPHSIPELLAFATRTDQLIATISSERPWEHPNAWEWDGMTFDSYLRQNLVHEDSIWVADTMAQLLSGNEARDYSLLWLLALVAGSEGLTLQQGVEQPGLYRFDGGSHEISRRFAQRWGKRVILDSPVRRIVQDKRSVTVISDKVTVKAKNVILAMPPFITTRIRFEPQLPAARAQLAQRVPNATVFRLTIVYDKPWWREDGLQGEAWCDFEPFLFAWDVSPPDGRCGILTSFISGAPGRRWARKMRDERREAVREGLVKLYGDPRAANWNEYYEWAWAFTEWTAACQFGVFPPGVLTDYGAEMRKPFGRIHWAGTEVAKAWGSSMEGAVRSGEAAADSALSA